MSINIIRPGMVTTIQDLGRYGFQKYGVVVGGAMDGFALRIANLLVGNHENEGALEITLTGPTLQINKDCLIAITGADMTPTIEDARIPLWKSVYVKRGTIIRFGHCIEGCRAYLAVSGGIDLPKVMDSYATYLRGNFGGYHGRPLNAGDKIKLNNSTRLGQFLINKLLEKSSNGKVTAAPWTISNKIIPYPNRVKSINDNITLVRIVLGGEFSDFTQESRDNFLKENFRVTSQSDRMGYRLSGPPLELSKPKEMISRAVAFGTIQVPPEGNPIVLMADRQTTGGYPQIAQIASVDLPILAQLKPGDGIRFREITIAEAQRLFIEREMNIQKIRQAIALQTI